MLYFLLKGKIEIFLIELFLISEIFIDEKPVDLASLGTSPITKKISKGVRMQNTVWKSQEFILTIFLQKFREINLLIAKRRFSYFHEIFFKRE